MSKPAFAPTPARAIADDRLSALDLRVLMVIAVHDRLGVNGLGCYAAPARMAKLIGVHEKSVSRSIGLLGEMGYLVAKPAPWDRRKRIYKIVYTDFDRAFISAKIGNETATDPQAERREKGNHPATESKRIGSDQATEISQIGNKDSAEHKLKQRDACRNILVESHFNKSCEAEINCAEARIRTGDEEALPPTRSIEEATKLLRQMLRGREIKPAIMDELRRRLFNGHLTRTEIDHHLREAAA